jgi:hypothetical protein
MKLIVLDMPGITIEDQTLRPILLEQVILNDDVSMHDEPNGQHLPVMGSLCAIGPLSSPIELDPTGQPSIGPMSVPVKDMARRRKKAKEARKARKKNRR